MDAALSRAEQARPTYPEVGRTRDALDGADLPPGWDHLDVTGEVGVGRDALEAAAATVLGWGMHRGAGLTVTASAPRADVGVTVVAGIGVGPLRLAAPCRVVWTLDEPDRRGFGYATLPGHPEVGEEAFVVTMDAAKVVRVRVLAVSRPGPWYVRAVAPVVPLAQRVAARRYVAAVRRSVPERLRA